MKVDNDSRCTFREFDDVVSAGRSIEFEDAGTSGVLVPFWPRELGPYVQREDGRQRDSRFQSMWDLLVEQRSAAAAKALGGASTDGGFAIAGLIAGLESIGVHDVKIPPNAGAHIGRSLSYRLPNDVWSALHGLDEGERGRVLMAMASALHDGRVRGGRYRPQMRLGHVLLPLELAGENRFTREACVLVRMLPCVGLDRRFDRPGDYGSLFAYEGEHAMSSPEFVALIEAFRKARTEYVRELGIATEEDILGFVEAYGRSCKLLDERAAAAFRDAEFVKDTAWCVIERGPARPVTEW